MEELVGTVDRLLFAHQENGFCVFLLALTRKETVTVCGNAPSIQAGQQVSVMGEWTMHPKFGKQFEAKVCRLSQPTSLEGLKKYLGSGLIKGIGKTYAEKLVNHFKTDVLHIIDKEPHRLSSIPGIGEKRIEMIVQAWKDQKEISSLMIFLQEKGASPAFAIKIYKQYGNDSIAKLTENPYRLAEDIWGVGFKTADIIAQNLGFEKESIKRIIAGIIFTITHHTSNGHLYIEITQLKKLIVEILELEPSEKINTLIKNALHHLHEQEKIKVITSDQAHYITLSHYYFIEHSVATKIKNHLAFPSPFSFNLQEIYKHLRTVKPGTLELNEAQQKGILHCLTNKMSIITGGPGTGKTTLIKKLLELLDTHKIIYRLAAPTGRAAKRITESTGRYSTTLHRLLEFNPQTMGFVHNETNALKVQFLIIDEASMLDIFLAHNLLKALPLTAHIIFIGDIDQLPSVGAGNFLNDLIASEVIPTTRLSYIFRQAHNSLIAFNAHRINAGVFPTSNEPNTIKDFYFIKEDIPENVTQQLKVILSTTVKKHGIDLENMIVLSPMNRGAAGTVAINHFLQTVINPGGSPEDTTSRMGMLFKKGDRVMQIRNNYDKIVFNGDIGTIVSVDQEEKTLIVQFEKAASYDFSELDELTLAYSISIHKSQGSEFDAVIVPIFTQHFTLLQRNLIYTAITRAKKLCIIIGQTRALAMAITNKKNIARTTFLTSYLTTDLTCR